MSRRSAVEPHEKLMLEISSTCLNQNACGSFRVRRHERLAERGEPPGSKNVYDGGHHLRGWPSKNMQERVVAEDRG